MQTATLALTHDAAYGSATAISRPRSWQRVPLMRTPECLQCNRPLWRVRTLLFGGRFCSGAHKAAYLEELDALMIARLVESGKRIQAAMGLNAVGEEHRAA